MPSQIPAERPYALLDRDVRGLPGIGAVRAASLHEAGLATVWDLLHAPPRPAPPPPPRCDAGPLPAGIAVRIRAQVTAVSRAFRRRGSSLDVRLVRADGLTLRARFFHAAYLGSKLLVGQWYRWEGRMDGTARLLLQPRFAASLGADEPHEPPGLRMRYAEVPGLSAAGFGSLLEHVLRTHLGELADPLRELPAAEYQRLVEHAHRPGDLDAWHEAMRALARRELRALAWRLRELLPAAGGVPGRAWAWSGDTERAGRAMLPYALSPGQEECLPALRADLQAARPMVRLLQGEVGSGKTAVAFLAILAVAAQGGQSLLLAPTEVLAEQHLRWFQERLQGSRHRCALLSGALGGAARAPLLDELASGRIGLLIGTHAALHDEVVLPTLGLVVIDEQHRFGVGQRLAALSGATRRQGFQPDLLLMSATPIPRTLALTIYGEMPVTILRGRPPGHAAVQTVLRALQEPAQVEALVREALLCGGRVFVVCARKWSAASGLAAVDIHARLAGARDLDTPVALVHGDCSPQERITAMEDFHSGRARVLVATSLIEVGLDVPQATHLIVLEAERFGLAQLHQLRGRLGRGVAPGICILAHGAAAGAVPDEGPSGAAARARLELLVATSDGLVISEADLRDRGAGDLLGTLQHGAYELRLADLGRDLDLLMEAHAAVRAARDRAETCPRDLQAFIPVGTLPRLVP